MKLIVPLRAVAVSALFAIAAPAAEAQRLWVRAGKLLDVRSGLYRRKEMILEPNATLRDAFEADMGGAAFRLDSAGFIVTDMMRGGPAALAGFREGDLVVSIDGKPALEFGIEALRRRLKLDGGELSFLVRRSDGDVTIRLPVRRLI